MNALCVQAPFDSIELSETELELLNGGDSTAYMWVPGPLGVGGWAVTATYKDQSTNWASVVGWGIAGGGAGSFSGPWSGLVGAGLGMVASYIDQHFSLYFY